MPIKFSPKYTITDKMAGFLLRIEATKELSKNKLNI